MRAVVALLASIFCVLLLAACPKKPPPQAELGAPLLGLAQEHLDRFQKGKVLFQRKFTPETGLGPLFNADACGECHEDPVAGGAGDEAEVHSTRFSAPEACDPLFQEGGPVIQQLATPLLRAKGVEKEEIPPSASGQGLRSAGPIFGFGLIDGIPESAILASEDPDDSDRDGISGRANRFIDGRVGRFGRKAFVPSLFEFNAGAFPIEQGVTTPFSPVEETINGKAVPPDTDPVADPEIQVADIEATNDFVRFLAPPPRKFVSGFLARRRVARGQKLFRHIGCARCHVPSMKTGPSDIPTLNNQSVNLFSDLLLHDMGPELADICLGRATPGEFRTELLMGLRFRERFMHDGSAKSVSDAIERHGGEASRVREAFRNLKEKDKKALLEFLDTI